VATTETKPPGEVSSQLNEDEFRDSHDRFPRHCPSIIHIRQIGNTIMKTTNPLMLLMVTITAIAAVFIAVRLGHPAQQPGPQPSPTPSDWTKDLLPCPDGLLRYPC
jgi:hypothetical protein